MIGRGDGNSICPSGGWNRNRRGVSLFELTIVISMLAALMSFGTVLLGLLFRADAVGHDALARQLSMARLSRQFRADGHATREVVLDDSTGRLELALDDGRRVTWSSEEAGVLRVVLRNDVEVARDQFALPDGVTTFAHRVDQGLVELRHIGGRPLVVEHGAAGEATPADVVRIEAAIGIEVGARGAAISNPASSEGEGT